MIKLALFTIFVSLSAFCDCGLVGDIKMRLQDCASIKTQTSELPVISFSQKNKIIYFYDESNDTIRGPLFNNKCLSPYKKDKSNKKQSCILKKASQYYLLGNEIEFMQ